MRPLLLALAAFALLDAAVPTAAQAGTYRACSQGSQPSTFYGLKRYRMTCAEARTLLRAVEKRFTDSGSAQTLPRSVNGYRCTYVRSAGIDFSGRCFSKRRNEGIRFRGATVDA